MNRTLWFELWLFTVFSSFYKVFTWGARDGKFQFDQESVDEKPLCGCATSKSLFTYLLGYLKDRNAAAHSVDTGIS